MKIYVSSLGCKLNQSEMDSLAEQLAADGHQVVGSPAEAELCVLNTCAVTHVAAQKSRQTLRRLHRDNPNARLIATGCYAELEPDALNSLPGVDKVVGNPEKEQLGTLIGPSAVRRKRIGAGAGIPHMRTRALVKIQDGCDNACTYCIIHVARGPQHSRPADEILTQVRALLAKGYQEIVLTGVHIGAYGRDQQREPPKTDLWSLVERILTETDVPRLRLSSIEPWDLSEHAFPLWDDPRLCRHLHLPLQSGCNATLHRMARRYTTDEFKAWVTAARAAIPDLAVTTDIIVGFPGETEEEFAQSLDFVQGMAFSRTHVFPFSARAGTPAMNMLDPVSPQVKAKRARAMRKTASTSQQAFGQSHIGRTLDVLWESEKERREGTFWSGLTDNYLRVYTRNSANLANKLIPARLVSTVGSGLLGEIET